RGRLAGEDLWEFQELELVGQLARFARTKIGQDLLSETLIDPTARIEARRVVLGAMAQSGVRDVPKAWVDGLTAALASPELVLHAGALDAVAALPIPRDQARELIP